MESDNLDPSVLEEALKKEDEVNFTIIKNIQINTYK